jgi:LPXTG-site transpeptidase (sortase) family protein
MGVRASGRAAASGLLLAVLLTACGTAAAPLPTGSAPVGQAAPAPSATAQPDSGDEGPANVTPASVEIAGAGAAPVGLANVADDGSLDVPKDVDELGWWIGSKPMGADSGVTLIAGHVDSAVAGLGYFAKLTELQEGDPITVVDGLGEKWAFTVDRTEQISKTALPQDVFDTDGDRKLVLITCGGDFDAAKGSYVDNYIVYATPAAA